MTTYKTVSKKKRKLPAKMLEETPWNKQCVNIIVSYNICRKGKYPLILKSVTIIYPVTGWFEVMQYSDKKRALLIRNWDKTK